MVESDSPKSSVSRSYVRLIITADRVVIPQDGFEQRPQFHEFVARLLTGIAEAAAAHQRREDAANIGGGNGGAAGGQPPPSAGDDYEGATYSSSRHGETRRQAYSGVAQRWHGRQMPTLARVGLHIGQS